MRAQRQSALSKHHLLFSLAFAAMALISCSAPDQTATADSDFIEGRVLSSGQTPEAGVWVIAETNDLETPYRKIVVTNEEGRFLIPELPEAEYDVWVRGYGLADSDKATAQIGGSIEIQVSAASDAEEAAAIYPASYWLSMFEPPKNDPDWASTFKLGCQLCHQIGSSMTRYKDREGFDLAVKKATHMNATADYLGRAELLDALANWSSDILDGDVPPSPPRPEGIERNLVITEWAWGDGFTYAHDEIATDKRDPNLYANGPIYGVDLGNDRLLALDPKTHEASSIDVPTMDGFSTPWCNQTYQGAMLQTGEEVIPMGFGSLGCPVEPGLTSFEGMYDNPANPHNPMMDSGGKVWMTTQIRREWDTDLPAFCQEADGIADLYHHRQLGYYDTRSGDIQLIDTCYGTHHLQFDERGVLWMSGDVFVIGWFDPSKYDPAEPSSLERSQGWAKPVIDSDGDGSADTQLVGFNYGIIPNPSDGTIWTAQPGGNPGDPIDFRGRLVRYNPEDSTFETFTPPQTRRRSARCRC